MELPGHFDCMVHNGLESNPGASVWGALFHRCLVLAGVLVGFNCRSGDWAAEQKMDEFAEKRSVFGCSSVPVCPGMLCAGMGEEQEGQAWGDRPWHHGGASGTPAPTEAGGR